jgi:hypothetical protein
MDLPRIFLPWHCQSCSFPSGRFYKKTQAPKNFSDSVAEPRAERTSYPLTGILQTALANVLFRMESKHAFHQEGRQTSKSEAAIAKFTGIESGRLPSSRTIDDVLNRLNPEEMNEVLMSLFEVLRKDKLFASHRELTPQGAYHLAIDAETIHKYTPESAHDSGQCPHCLKRQKWLYENGGSRLRWACKIQGISIHQ